ncbi:MAG TPA: hypothetical protein PK544_03415 [Spirochaetota bacterium]|nr:hypothetical protein [Spirochaetota bacterium]
MKKTFYMVLVMLCLQTAENIVYSNSENQSGSPFSQSQFVPDISFILDLAYIERDITDTTRQSLFIPGMTYSSEYVSSIDDDTASEQNGRGFSFNYGEMNIASVVDPYFDLFVNLSFTEEGVEFEEGYFTSRSFPFGFQLKAGKFLSSFGRLNEQHGHFWDFFDQPLIYSVVFGEGNLNETGMRLTWVAPFDFYMMLGVEALQGRNSASFGSKGFSDVQHNVTVDDARGPNLYVTYLKYSYDFDTLTLLMGGSGALGKTRLNMALDQSGIQGEGYNGSTHIWGGDITLKYLIDSFRYISLQAEYIMKTFDGRQYTQDTADNISSAECEKVQSGMYAQLVLKPFLQWRFAARYDLLNKNRIEYNGTRDTEYPENMPRYSCMIDYNPTEFSRFRIQYNHDRSHYYKENNEYVNKPNNEIIVQCNLSIGAHGAHSF